MRKIKKRAKTTSSRKNAIKKTIIVVFSVLLSLIPLAFAAASYNSVNRNTDLLALDQINVSLYDTSNTLLESETSSLLYAKEDSLVKIFHSVLTNKTPLRFPPFSASPNHTTIIATVTSDKINETLTCYFSTTNSDSYCTDSSGAWFKITEEDTKSFLASSYSEPLYEYSAPPVLSTADGDIILPSAVDWYYKNHNSEFVPASKNKISNQTVSYNITDSLGLQFATQPDWCTVTVHNEENEVIYEGTLTEISNITVNSDESLFLEVYAEWQRSSDQNLYYGSTTYEFDVKIRNHSEFYISDDSISPNKFIVLSCTNISNPDDLEFSTDLYGFSPNFAYDGDILRCLIPFPINHYSDKFNLSLKYGASSDTFSININRNASTDSGAGDSEVDKKLTDILRSAPTPLNIKNSYIKDDFLNPTSHGFVQKALALDSSTIIANEFIAKEPYQKVLATTSGKIVATEKHDPFGNTVIIDHGLGLQTWYFGLSDITVSAGDYITKGEMLGRSGMCELSSANGFIFMVSVNERIIYPEMFFDFSNYRINK